MLIWVFGGFRYLTAAGNAAALADAKDTIWSALYGLLLALCTWIIVSTINPDLFYLKQPGTTANPPDYSCIPHRRVLSQFAIVSIFRRRQPGSGVVSGL